MGLLLFSAHEIHYEGGHKNAVQALYVPTGDKVKTFSDLAAEKVEVIAERYGAKGQIPLWRARQGQVTIYGTLPYDLADRRQEVQVYLPEDLAPAGVDTFYYVMGTQWLVHGVRERNDEGQVEWGVTRMEAVGKDVVALLIDTLSARMLLGGDEVACVAVTGNTEAYDKLKTELTPFNLKVERLETLRPARHIKPLYKHSNFNMLMLSTAFFALLMIIATGLYWALANRERVAKEQEVVMEQEKIQQIELNKNIGDIRNPRDVLAKMAKPLQRAPSSILHAAANAGAAMGELAKIRFRVADSTDLQVIDNEKYVLVEVNVKSMVNTFLVDQEKLANSLIEEMPWVQSVKYISRALNRTDDAWVQLTIRVE